MAENSSIEWTDSTTLKRAYDQARYIRRREATLAARPPDPISLLSDLDAAYLAGLIDGEGSFYIGAVGRERDRTCYPIFAMGMTDQGIIAWVADLLATVVSYVLKGGRNKPQFFVRLSGKRVQALCRRLAPFLRVKARQALLITTFPADARVGPGVKIGRRSAINVERERLRYEVNALNHAPRNKASRRAVQ